MMTRLVSLDFMAELDASPTVKRRRTHRLGPFVATAYVEADHDCWLFITTGSDSALCIGPILADADDWLRLR